MSGRRHHNPEKGSAAATAHHRLRVLVIGSLPPPLGGTSVLLQQLIAELEHLDEVAVEIVDTSSRQSATGLRDLWRGLRAFALIGKAIRRADVVTLHAATRKLHFSGPMVLCLTQLFRKPLIIRKFGGTTLAELPPLARRVVGGLLRHCDLYLAETKALVNLATTEGIPQVRWFPNHRPLSAVCPPPPEPGHRCCRFVYLGHVRADKGIHELIEAARQLDGRITVDVYGPLLEEFRESRFANLTGIRYGGALGPDEVLDTLRRYDALVLPSYHEGEGHPGVILEAFRAGLPVVTTKWRAIPEIVDADCGLLVEPRNIASLRDAMDQLHQDPALYARLCVGVRERARQFSTPYWAGRFVQYCHDVVGKDRLLQRVG